MGTLQDGIKGSKSLSHSVFINTIHSLPLFHGSPVHSSKNTYSISLEYNLSKQGQ